MNSKSRFNKDSKDRRLNEDANFAKDMAKGPLKEGTIKLGLEEKTRKNLRFGSVSVKADPYTAALPGSEPYPPIAGFNKTIGPRYAGPDNLDGGNVQQYSYSVGSAYLQAYDYMRMRLLINYNYLPAFPADGVGDSYPGYELINEMRRANAEAGSVLNATTYTQLAFNQYAIETDLPMGSAQAVAIRKGDTTVSVYTEFPDVFYAFSMYYQIVLQTMYACSGTYNAFRAKMGTMLRTAFNREVPQLNSLFGLLKKNSFTALLNSINKSFEGEYFDKNFAHTNAMVTTVPSRRSNSYFDPVMEISTVFAHPSKFKVHILNATKNEVIGNEIDMMALLEANIEGVKKTIFDIQSYLGEKLSAEDTVYWARNTTIDSEFANTRFNRIKYHYDALNLITTQFKAAVADFREALDVLSRTSIIGWTKGFRPAVSLEEDAPMVENRFVSDIVRTAMSSARDVEFNDMTKRWRTFTLWSMYNGIPEYDITSGGAVLTFSFKQFVGSSADSTISYVPKLFSGQKDGTYDVQCQFTNRSGDRVSVTRGDAVTVQGNRILARLAPLLSQSSEYIRVPTATIPGDDIVARQRASLLYKTLCQVFGLCSVTFNGVEDTALDPDIIAIYQIELEDITNEALTFARSLNVIRGSSITHSFLGFGGAGAQ